MQIKGPCLLFFFPLILMHKDAGEDKKKYFLILQMSSFNLDNVLSLLAVLGQFIIFPESVSFDAVCPDVSCTIIQKVQVDLHLLGYSWLWDTHIIPFWDLRVDQCSTKPPLVQSSGGNSYKHVPKHCIQYHVVLAPGFGLGDHGCGSPLVVFGMTLLFLRSYTKHSGFEFSILNIPTHGWEVF